MTLQSTLHAQSKYLPTQSRRSASASNYASGIQILKQVRGKDVYLYAQLRWHRNKRTKSLGSVPINSPTYLLDVALMAAERLTDEELEQLLRAPKHMRELPLK